MKSVRFLLICYFVLFGFQCQASEANEDLTRALVVVRLINQVKWPQDIFNLKSSHEFLLCIFDDSRTYRVFNQTLKGVEIKERSIAVKNITDKEKASDCHALFLPKPNSNVVEWLIENNANNKTILVTEKKGYGEKGVHINIYLDNEGFFDFELNPDAFENSVHDVNPEIFELGKLISSNIAQKVKTLRTLVNNTEWPKGKAITDEFQLCTYPNNPFATFAEYFLTDSDLAGLKVILKRLNEAESHVSLEGCNALLLSENDNPQLNWLMNHRKALGLLLISNALGGESDGAHYSLKFRNDPQSRKFGINLMAFGITAHIPNYQLFNSAVIIKNDYPIISDLLAEIIKQTKWPKTSLLNTNKDDLGELNFCNYQNDIDLEHLKHFLTTRLVGYKNIVYNNLQGSKHNINCDVIFSGKPSNGENSYLFIKKNFPQALLITNQLTAVDKVANHSLIHFNLSLKAKIIRVEAFLQNIKNSRFKLDSEFINSVEIIGGNSND